MARILVVDDSDAIRSFVKSALEPEHQVTDAADWSTASRILFGSSLDLVILDVNLPVVKGGAIADALRHAKYPGKIVLYSAIAEEELRALTSRVGAAGYIVKPCDVDLLRIRVRRILKTSDSITPPPRP